MNSLVIFEIVLTLSSLGALALMRRTYFPMNLIWAFGVLTIGGAAALGAAVYGDIPGLKAYHTLFSEFAGSIGLICFALAALGGMFAAQFHQYGWWVTLICVSALTVTLLTGTWHLNREGQYVVIGILGLCSLYQLYVNPSSGLLLSLGTVFLIAAGLLSDLVAAQFSFDPKNVYHVFLSLSVLSFGLFASRE